MLQSFRTMSKSWVFKSLMVLLVISFGAWGIGDMFRGNPALRTVATVGSAKIPVSALEQRFQAGLPDARAALGPDLTATQARQMGVLERTLKLMIEEIALDLEAARLGLNVAQSVLLDRIKNEPSLRTKDGKFDAAKWQVVLNRAGMNEKAFFDQEARNMERQMILTSLTANVTAPKIMIDTLYQARGSKRVLEVVTLRNDSIKDIGTPTDEILQTYYNEHQDQFIAPEYRGITVAELSGADIAKTVTVSDEDVRAAYDSNPEDMTRNETRDLVQLVIQDEDKAKALAETAKTLHSLPEAAKAQGLTPITMSQIDEKNVLPELYATVFALDENQISDPVKSPMGWHIVQVKKINAGGKLSFDEAKETLRKNMQEDRAGDVIAKTINKLDDAIAGGTSLEDSADTMGLRLTRFAALDAQGLQPDGKEPKEAIPDKQRVLAAAQSLSAQETGQVMEDDRGNFIVVRVDQIKPSQPIPFAEAKDRVKNIWIEEQLYTKAAAAAEEIAKQLREGKTATSFASRPGIEVKLSKPLSVLGDTDRDLPQTLIPQIFKMQKGDVTVGARDGKQYVVRLSDIVAVDPDKPESSRLKIVDDLKTKVPQNLVEQYFKQIETYFPVNVDKEFVNNLKNQGG